MKWLTEENIRNINDYNQYMLLLNPDAADKNTNYKKRAIWSLKSAIFFYQRNPSQCFVSLPMLTHFGQISFDEFYATGIYIKVKDPSDRAAVKEIMDDLEAEGGKQPTDTWSQAQSQKKFKHIIDLVFSVIIGIMMFLCFFSLSASMTANLYD